MKIISNTFFAAVLMTASSLYAGFLVDENPEPSVFTPAESKNVTQSIGFPADTALKIDVTPLEGVHNSVRISWDLSPGSEDVFILGRTTVLPSTPKAALEAISIKIIPHGAVNAVIDRNIPNGSYYYVVLSKKKSAQKDFDLYPNENYTTNPINISSNVPARLGAPSQVKGIMAQVVNENEILLTWRPLDSAGVTYSVYRSNEPMNNPDKVKGSEKLAELIDRNKYQDRTAIPGNSYFYAVVTSDSSGASDLNLIPGESYTNIGADLIKREASSVVSQMRAEVTDRSSARITWNPIPDFNGEYLLYRSKEIISSAEKLARAEFAGSALSTAGEFFDKKAGVGLFYYAIIAKDSSGRRTNELFDGYNFTREPVDLKEPADPVRLKILKAESQGSSVTINWKFGGTDHRDFLLYRSEVMPQTKNDVADSFIVDTIDLRKNSFRDVNIPEGSYYYILVPDNFMEDRDLVLKKGITFTSTPVDVKTEFQDATIRIRGISAALLETGEIRVIWKFSGTEGSTNYSLIRMNKLPRTRDEIAQGDLAASIDISTGIYTDAPIEGSYYYAIVPEDYLSQSDLRIARGINVTSNAVLSALKKAGNTEQPKVTTDNKDVIKPKTDDITKRPDIIIPDTSRENLKFDSVDHVLKKYFYAKKYDTAIRGFLSIAKSSTDSSESARALFYAGRAYAEKGEYKTALNYFLNAKVKNAMPDKSAFWRDYCIKRMKK